MSVLTDYHLHSSFSGDSDAPMEAMIEKGIALGLKRMCFTEHMDMDYIYTEKEEPGCFECDTVAYRRGLLALQEKYADRIHILFGVELGLQPHLSQWLTDYVNAFDFDFVIGSSHLCNRKDPYYPAFYENRPEEEAYLEYFTSILDNLNAFSGFDVYGHLDYVVRYGPNKDRDYSYDRYKDILDAILKRIIALGKGIEINTGGISYGLRELNPCTDIIKRYLELGGEIITVGSDAHAPDRIACGFDRAADILKSCGCSYYTVFEKRRPKQIRL